MTRIKLCGLSRPADIACANLLRPDFIGFVFAPDSRRYVPFETAEALRRRLDGGILPVGVFTDAPIPWIARLVRRDVIRMVQLHGGEDNGYIKRLRAEIDCPIIQAFRVASEADVRRAAASEAEYVMLDAGGGTGEGFDHSLIGGLKRDFFLAGGLSSENVCAAIARCRPYAVDASSSLETDGVKDQEKMTAFVNAVRYGKDDGK